MGYLVMTKIVYRITYNVYRLNKVANPKLFQRLLRVTITLKYLIGTKG